MPPFKLRKRTGPAPAAPQRPLPTTAALARGAQTRPLRDLGSVLLGALKGTTGISFSTQPGVPLAAAAGRNLTPPPTLTGPSPEAFQQAERVGTVVGSIPLGIGVARGVAKHGVGAVLAAPRAIKSTLDLSAPLLQGLVAGVRYPKQFIRSFGQMFRSAGSEAAHTALKTEIASRPTYKLMRDADLALTAVDEGTLLLREEQFMSQLPESLRHLNIPVVREVGQVVRASNRGYTAFLTKLRADTFDELIKRSAAAGVEQTPELIKGIGKFVNAATGRGDLGRFAAIGEELGTALFSPRMMASRVNFLDFRGLWGKGFYGSLHPFARREALRAMLNLTALGTTVIGVAHLAGAKTGTDPRSADFGKIIIRNTRINIWGGFQQYPKLAAVQLTGKLVSTRTGRTIELGKGYRPLTRKDMAYSFFESKANPVVGTILQLMEERTFEGEKPTLPWAMKQLLAPMIAEDLYELAKEDPKLLPFLGPAAFFGASVQTYKPNKSGTFKLQRKR